MGRGLMNSARIHVILQKLAQPDLPAIDRLDPKEVSMLIGRRPGQPEQEAPTWAEPRQVLAGMMPLLRIGDIVRGTRIEGALRQQELTLTLTREAEVIKDKIFAERNPPKGWKGPYRMLNRVEYEVGTRREVRGSRCVKIKTGNIEYIFPCFVLMKTFYGFHTKLANAICNGPWNRRHDEVISTIKYDSGIGTYLDQENGAWNIVVQQGLTRDHAVRLAALYFDSYARGCANEIYSSSMVQTRDIRGDGGRYWFADAKIPYRWTETPLTMRVKALPLRALRSSAADCQRYLVTSIDATSWPFPDQEIYSEIANSSALSPDPEPEKAQAPFRKYKAAPVRADQDAQLNHHSDAYKNAADNLVDADDFSFLNAPKHLPQLKSSHKRYEGTRPPPSEGPSLTLSAGNTAPGEGKPAPLVAESRDRRLAPQLQLLWNALEVLRASGAIEAFNAYGPPDLSNVKQMRGGIPCWSFVNESQLRAISAGRRPKGWAFIFDTPAFEGGHRQAMPRCLLVVHIKLNRQELVLFEVEPRSTESAYRFYIVKPTLAFDWQAIRTAMEALRAASGRLDASARLAAFRALTNHPSSACNHAYERDGENNITALMTSALLRALKDACRAPVDQTEPADDE